MPTKVILATKLKLFKIDYIILNFSRYLLKVATHL